MCVRVGSSKSTAKERKKDRFLNDENFARVASERARARLPTSLYSLWSAPARKVAFDVADESILLH